MPPILTSLLDTDAYKLHMQQAVFHRYPDAEVVAEFHSRNEEDSAAHDGADRGATAPRRIPATDQARARFSGRAPLLHP